MWWDLYVYWGTTVTVKVMVAFTYYFPCPVSCLPLGPSLSEPFGVFSSEAFVRIFCSFLKLHFVVFFFSFFFTTPQGKMCGFLNLQPEIKSVPLAVEAWSANHWEPGKPLVVFLWLSFRSCLYIFICKYFLPDCYLSLRSLNHVSKRVDIFCFFLVQCVSFFFHVSCFWYLRNFCLTQGCNDFSPMFLLRVLLF